MSNFPRERERERERGFSFQEKQRFYKNEIDDISAKVYNAEQKQLARNIIDAANEHNIDALYTFVTQRIKLGFRFDAAPEVNHSAVSLVKKNDKMSFGTIGTKHKMIIGENYDALKNLLVTYTKDGKGLVDVIYIDPPYNTEASKADGNDHKSEEVTASKFMYRDKFTRNGWLNFMRERLVMARKLLSESGVIFISIDDNEQAYLKVLCDEIFGEENFETTLVWRKNSKQGNTKQINRTKITHEYILCYSLLNNFNKIKLLPNWKNEKTNADNDPRGVWESGIISLNEDKSDINSENYYSITLPSGRIMTREFYFSKEKFEELRSDDRIYFPKDGDGVPRLKIFQNEEKEFYFDSIMDEVGTFTNAKEELLAIFNNREIFDTPKTIKMIKEIIRSTSKPNSIVLDFFAGSGTTAQAVMELNEEDGGHRQCILVANNENNIGKGVMYERIYRVVNGIGTNGETFAWEYKKDQKCLPNNVWDIFEIETHELKIDDFDKAGKLLEEAEREFKNLNEHYEYKDFDIYNQLASLNPYKK